MLSVRDYEKLGKPRLRISRTTLNMYDGTARKILGVVWVDISNRDGKPTRLEFELLETRHHTPLSLDTCLKQNLLSYTYEMESVCLVEAKLNLTRKQILDDYSDVFKGIGRLPGKYNIETDPLIPPVQNRPRRIPHVMKALVIQKLRSLEKSRMMARVETPTEWISNLTAVWKVDKILVRVCLDPRMPFGLSSAPEEFHSRLQGALHGIQGVVMVAYDILVFGKGKSEEEARWDHNKALLQLLWRAREQILKFNKDKMRLHFSELFYIEHWVSPQGIQPGPAKVSVLKTWWFLLQHQM